MLNKKTQTELVAASIGEFYPKLIRNFYLGCTKEGFNTNEALTLTTEYMKIIIPNWNINTKENKDETS